MYRLVIRSDPALKTAALKDGKMFSNFLNPIKKEIADVS